MSITKTVFVSLIKKPERKVIIKRGIRAAEYFEYCAEVGCDIWEMLTKMESMSEEPVCLWLPSKYRKPNTSEYVQGVEVASDYDGEVPDGFDKITLPACEYLVFQGEPFEEEKYGEAIGEVRDAIRKYNPAPLGYEWDDENPGIQLAPVAERGYIELRAVKKVV